MTERQLTTLPTATHIVSLDSINELLRTGPTDVNV